MAFLGFSVNCQQQSRAHSDRLDIRELDHLTRLVYICQYLFSVAGRRLVDRVWVAWLRGDRFDECSVSWRFDLCGPFFGIISNAIYSSGLRSMAAPLRTYSPSPLRVLRQSHQCGWQDQPSIFLRRHPRLPWRQSGRSCSGLATPLALAARGAACGTIAKVPLEPADITVTATVNPTRTTAEFPSRAPPLTLIASIRNATADALVATRRTRCELTTKSYARQH